MQFINLTSASSPKTNPPTNNVLSVDASGNVILIPGGGAGATLAADNGLLINPNNDGCTTQPHVELGGFLDRNTEIQLYSTTCDAGNYNLYFSGQTTTDATYPYSNVGIGIPMGSPSASLAAKLDVEQDNGVNNSNTPVITNDANNENVYSIGINQLNTFDGQYIDDGEVIGIRSDVNGTTNSQNVGGKFIAEECYNNLGGEFVAQNAQTNGSNTGASFSAFGGTGVINTGVLSSASDGLNNYGVIGVVNSNSSGTISNIGGYFLNGPLTAITGNYGVYAQAPVNSTSWAGWFQGNVNINGPNSTVNGNAMTSDRLFKTNIDSIHNALNIINQLKPKSFYFDTTNIYGLNFNSAKQYGLIAQDVEPILPELVGSINKPATYNSSGTLITSAITYKTLNYNAFFAIILKGMQEQQSQIKSKDSVNSILNNRIDSLKNVVAVMHQGSIHSKL